MQMSLVPLKDAHMFLLDKSCALFCVLDFVLFKKKKDIQSLEVLKDNFVEKQRHLLVRCGRYIQSVHVAVSL